MTTPRRAFLLLDANVLIDYLKSDLSILVLADRHVGGIRIPITVIEEVDGIDLDVCNRLGLNVVEPELGLLIAAAERRGSLSYPDHLCLILARENGWVCVTNDKALRNACKSEGIVVSWGLEIMLDLVRTGQLAPKKAREIAEAIHRANPFHVSPEILRRFADRLREISSK